MRCRPDVRPRMPQRRPAAAAPHPSLARERAPPVAAVPQGRWLPRAAGRPTRRHPHRRGPAGPWGRLVIPVLGRQGVPASGVGAVQLHVTAVGASAASHLTVHPNGSAPTTSSLNYEAGRAVGNTVTARPAPTAPSWSRTAPRRWTSSSTSSGWVAAPRADSRPGLHAVAPRRVWDSRVAGRPVGARGTSVLVAAARCRPPPGQSSSTSRPSTRAPAGAPAVLGRRRPTAHDVERQHGRGGGHPGRRRGRLRGPHLTRHGWRHQPRRRRRRRLRRRPAVAGRHGRRPAAQRRAPASNTQRVKQAARGHGITGNDLTGHRLAEHPDFVTRATRAGLPTLLAVSGWPPLALAEDGGPLFAEASTREFTAVPRGRPGLGRRQAGQPGGRPGRLGRRRRGHHRARRGDPGRAGSPGVVRLPGRRRLRRARHRLGNRLPGGAAGR